MGCVGQIYSAVETFENAEMSLKDLRRQRKRIPKHVSDYLRETRKIIYDPFMEAHAKYLARINSERAWLALDRGNYIKELFARSAFWHEYAAHCPDIPKSKN